MLSLDDNRWISLSHCYGPGVQDLEGPYLRTIMKAALVIAFGSAAFWLLNDAMTFALYAPSAARAGGCYTKIELWLGTTEPDDRLRTAELFSGLALLMAAVGWPVVTVVRRVRRAESA
jgi:hypothetical protein